MQTMAKQHRVAHPTTSDRIYSHHEFEFLKEIQRYKDETGRSFATNSEIYHILTERLGYSQHPLVDAVARPLMIRDRTFCVA